MKLNRRKKYILLNLNPFLNVATKLAPTVTGK